MAPRRKPVQPSRSPKAGRPPERVISSRRVRRREKTASKLPKTPAAKGTTIPVKTE